MSKEIKINEILIGFYLCRHVTSEIPLLLSPPMWHLHNLLNLFINCALTLLLSMIKPYKMNYKKKFSIVSLMKKQRQHHSKHNL